MQHFHAQGGRRRLALAATASLLALATLGFGGQAWAQVIGSYDNFDVFNDTGGTAEGFEIDVEDVKTTDLIREFPSNFAGQPGVIRYGLPTVTAYDWTKSTPDAAHAFDAKHKGVLIKWAATLKNGQWVAAYGAAAPTAGAAGAAGNGTPFNPHPTATLGESCWWYGLGAQYPKAGCDHFGISFAPGISPGRMIYHWLVPDISNQVLVTATLEANIPGSPLLVVAKPAVGVVAPPVVKAVARAPADFGGNPEAPQALEPQFGDAVWLKTTTLYSNVRARLEGLQVHNLKAAPGTKTVTWTLMQRSPGVGANAGAAERELAEKDAFPNANVVQVTKQYQYYKFSGAYDSETHQALCDQFYGSAAAALAGGATVQVSCQNANGDDAPYSKTYYTIDPGPGTVLTAVGGDLGDYIGAHVNAYNAK